MTSANCVKSKRCRRIRQKLTRLKSRNPKTRTISKSNQMMLERAARHKVTLEWGPQEMIQISLVQTRLAMIRTRN